MFPRKLFYYFRYLCMPLVSNGQQDFSLIHANRICFSDLFLLFYLIITHWLLQLSTWIHTHIHTHWFIHLFVCFIVVTSSASSTPSIALLSPFNAVRKLLKTNKGWSQPQTAKVLSCRKIKAINWGGMKESKEREREGGIEVYLPELLVNRYAQCLIFVILYER